MVRITMNKAKAKPAPDFSKLHQKWETKLKKGKAVTKKPLTQIQPFDLSNPATLTYKLKQKLDFEKAIHGSTLLDDVEEEKFETSPTAKEKILSEDNNPMNKAPVGKRTTFAGPASSKHQQGRTRSTSFYTKSSIPARQSFVLSGKKTSKTPSTANKENAGPPSIYRQSRRNETSKIEPRCVASATGFERINVEFKPDPEARKSIFLEPDSSPLRHCQAPFRRSTFTGKMKTNHLSHNMPGKKLSIYARPTFMSKTQDMSLRQFMDHLKRDSFLIRQRRSSIYQSTTNSVRETLPRVASSNDTNSATTAPILQSTGLPKPVLPTTGINTLVGFQGGSFTSWQPTRPTGPSINSQASTQLFQSTLKQTISSTKMLGVTRERGQIEQELTPISQQSNIRLCVPLNPPMSFGTKEMPNTNVAFATGTYPKPAEKLAVSPETGNECPVHLRSALKKAAPSDHSEKKRNVQWSDILASENNVDSQVNSAVQPSVDRSESTSDNAPRARKALEFNHTAKQKEGASCLAVKSSNSRSLQTLPLNSYATPIRVGTSSSSDNITTPITADEIRRRGIDPLSFDHKSPLPLWGKMLGNDSYAVPRGSADDPMLNTPQISSSTISLTSSANSASLTLECNKTYQSVTVTSELITPSSQIRPKVCSVGSLQKKVLNVSSQTRQQEKPQSDTVSNTPTEVGNIHWLSSQSNPVLSNLYDTNKRIVGSNSRFVPHHKYFKEPTSVGTGLMFQSATTTCTSATYNTTEVVPVVTATSTTVVASSINPTKVDDLQGQIYKRIRSGDNRFVPQHKYFKEPTFVGTGSMFKSAGTICESATYNTAKVAPLVTTAATTIGTTSMHSTKVDDLRRQLHNWTLDSRKNMTPDHHNKSPKAFAQEKFESVDITSNKILPEQEITSVTVERDCHTPDSSSISFLDLSNVLGCPSCVRRKARTSHSKDEGKDETDPEVKAEHGPEVKTEHGPEVITKHGPEVITEHGQEVKTEHNPEVRTEHYSEVKAEHGEKKANECVKNVNTKSSDDLNVREHCNKEQDSSPPCSSARDKGTLSTANFIPQQDIVISAHEEELSSVADVIVSRESERKVNIGSSVWTHVQPQCQISYLDEEQRKCRILNIDYVSDGKSVYNSPMLDLEVSLICQKIDLRRKHHQFTPIRESCSNPIAKQMKS